MRFYRSPSLDARLSENRIGGDILTARTPDQPLLNTTPAPIFVVSSSSPSNCQRDTGSCPPVLRARAFGRPLSTGVNAPTGVKISPKNPAAAPSD